MVVPREKEGGFFVFVFVFCLGAIILHHLLILLIYKDYSDTILVYKSYGRYDLE